jgi:hypothetical protein
MPKIKELNNSQLNDYLEAYQSAVEEDPNNLYHKEKVKLITQALRRRELLQGAKNNGLVSKLKNLLKKK